MPPRKNKGIELKINFGSREEVPIEPTRKIMHKLIPP
jgi:hypothetical protein